MTELDSSEPIAMVRIPRLLFRYLRDNEHLVDTLLTPYLWFSDPASLNDPFDFTDVLDFEGTPEEMLLYLRRYLGALSPDWFNQNEEHLRRQLENRESPWWKNSRLAAAALHKIYLERVALCCFSFENSSTLMWSHYSGGHTGVCLVLGVSPWLRREYALIEVNYWKTLPRWNMVSNRLQHGKSMAFNRSFDQVALGSKFRQWEYEKEYRLISRRRGKHVIDPRTVLGLILGAKMSLERRSQLKAMVLDRFPNIAVVDAGLDREKGVVTVSGFTNSLVNIASPIWRSLDDKEPIMRDAEGNPSPLQASTSLEAIPEPTWCFDYHLKVFDPSYRMLPNGRIDFELDDLVNPELMAAYRPDQAFLMPSAGSRASGPISPQGHVADIINLALSSVRKAERHLIRVGPDYIVSWFGVPGYKVSCSQGQLDIIALTAKIEFTFISPSYYELEADPTQVRLLQHWSPEGVVEMVDCASVLQATSS